MDLFPAIDLIDGEAVRLVQGDFDRRHGFGDPLELARRYRDAGARWVHVVDLDAARSGGAPNRAVVLAIAGQSGMQVQAGGGLRAASDVETLLESGVARVVLGTAALADPAFATEMAMRFPGRVVLGLDHRGGGADVATDGWVRESGTSLDEALDRFAHVDLAAVVVTNIERDGVAAGPDLSGLARVLERTRHPVVASGGVRSADDLRALNSLSAGGRALAGAVVGRALVDGSLDVREAVTVCAASG